MKQYSVDSVIGRLYLVASEKGLQGIYFQKQAGPLEKSLDRSAKNRSPAIKHLSQAAKELTQYFAGKRKKFGLALDLKTGTAFQKKVWLQLSKIPYGKTYSYADIALKIKNPKAVRAVGNANGKNPLCIIVPCHRVIASNGKLGGYTGGLEKKIKLLKIETRKNTSRLKA